MSNIVLQTEGLTKRFGSLVAVKDLSLEVYEGEVFGFLGPNGAGKTTSINMMCGLLKPDAGSVTIRGIPVADGDPDLRARVGVCPQDTVLWERLSCLEQLQFVGQMYGLTGREARRRGEELLEELDLTEKRKSQARTLSGGMQRRLNLAMALVHDPEIVVLDEAEAGLDPQSRVKVREYIQSMARKKTVILTTHNMDEADRVADRVAIIDHGQLLVLDTPEALKQQVGEGDVVEIGLIGALDDELPERIETKLASWATQFRLDDKRRVLTVRALNAVGTLPSILHGLEEVGLQPGEVRVRENTLEDVFIQLTGRRLRE
jgi:ABC-2 type transport system ATP-binding protein